MILALLFACGVDGGLDQPNPPPTPPPQLTKDDPGVVRQTGLVSEVHGPTRSFVLTGEGKRVIVHLRDTGTLRIAGQPVQIADLQPGTTLWVEGKRQGDLLVIERAADSPEEPPAEAPAATDPAATDPAAAPAATDPAAAPSATDPAAAPAATTDGATTPAPATPPTPPKPLPTPTPSP